MTASTYGLLASLAALGVPLTFAFGAWRARDDRAFVVAREVTATTLGATLVGGFFALGANGSPLGVRFDLLAFAMLGLVCGLAAVLVRFSDRYLGGDPGRPRYVRWLLATLASVTLLVVTDHLLVLALAWTSTSLCLHQLLTFYERPTAHVAAHQKFLVSRLADLCLLAAVALVWHVTGDARLPVLEAHVAAYGVSTELHLAATLVALAIALKSAQLPFHGWLLQVMEAPTPVSALLHAGVVNVGGYVALRLARLFEGAPLALGVLVVFGSVTALVAALAARRQPTVKSTLAWSTCAQMGFMLVQCGLGAWDLALLHLLAHSAYKAHAFLGAGETVARARVAALAPTSGPTFARVLFAFVVVGGSALALFGLGDARSLGLAIFVAASLASPLARVPRGAWPVAALASVAFVALYGGWHLVFATWWPPTTPPLGLAITAGVFAVLLATLQLASELAPRGALAGLATRAVVLGTSLDAVFARVAFRVWPPRLPGPALASSFASTPTQSGHPLH